MTPRAEAMVVWRCPECGRRGLDYGGRRTLVCFWNGEDSQHTGAEVERIEVVPAVELERALDALEEFVKWFDSRYPGGEGSPLPGVTLYSLAEKARAVLRAAGRLDG